MKNRRIVITSFLLIAVLVMGIAYATLADNLFIKGEANVATTAARQEFDADVYFVQEANLEDSIVECNGTGSEPTGLTNDKLPGVHVGTTDPDSATFYVYHLGQQGEYVVFSFTIQNDSTEFDAIISVDSGYPQTTNSDKFAIEFFTGYDTSTHTGSGSEADTVTCPSGGTVTVYVKVTLKASPEENLSAAFNVNLTASSTPKA